MALTIIRRHYASSQRSRLHRFCMKGCLIWANNAGHRPGAPTNTCMFKRNVIWILKLEHRRLHQCTVIQRCQRPHLHAASADSRKLPFRARVACALRESTRINLEVYTVCDCRRQSKSPLARTSSCGHFRSQKIPVGEPLGRLLDLRYLMDDFLRPVIIAS